MQLCWHGGVPKAAPMIDSRIEICESIEITLSPDRWLVTCVIYIALSIGSDFPIKHFKTTHVRDSLYICDLQLTWLVTWAGRNHSTRMILIGTHQSVCDIPAWRPQAHGRNPNDLISVVKWQPRLIIDYGYGLSLFLERKQLKGRKTAVKVGIISAAHRFRFTGGWLRVIFQAERSHWSTSPGELLRPSERSWQDEHLSSAWIMDFHDGAGIDHV
jgi:hypothetical protein